VSRPDLSGPEQRSAYRAELRRLYRPWRYGALALLVIAVIGGIVDRDAEPLWSILVVIGAVVIASVIVARTRYHQRRMRG
jgi:hypothetical protein